MTSKFLKAKLGTFSSDLGKHFREIWTKQNLCDRIFQNSLDFPIQFSRRQWKNPLTYIGHKSPILSKKHSVLYPHIIFLWVKPPYFLLQVIQDRKIIKFVCTIIIQLMVQNGAMSCSCK